ncbi:hypothetical protein, partial [Klebsiella pneumoniae]|uniref:hypothetical protein n=1 Tax=Klebsiella pneumoniae TaxID=573 RepID=UPI001954DD3B
MSAWKLGRLQVVRLPAVVGGADGVEAEAVGGLLAGAAGVLAATLVLLAELPPPPQPARASVR